jgi:hypothetical protein
MAQDYIRAFKESETVTGINNLIYYRLEYTSEDNDFTKNIAEICTPDLYCLTDNPNTSYFPTDSYSLFASSSFGMSYVIDLFSEEKEYTLKEGTGGFAGTYSLSQTKLIRRYITRPYFYSPSDWGTKALDIVVEDDDEFLKRYCKWFVGASDIVGEPTIQRTGVSVYREPDRYFHRRSLTKMGTTQNRFVRTGSVDISGNRMLDGYRFTTGTYADQHASVLEIKVNADGTTTPLLAAIQQAFGILSQPWHFLTDSLDDYNLHLCYAYYENIGVNAPTAVTIKIEVRFQTYGNSSYTTPVEVTTISDIIISDWQASRRYYRYEGDISYSSVVVPDDALTMQHRFTTTYTKPNGDVTGTTGWINPLFSGAVDSHIVVHTGLPAQPVIPTTGYNNTPFWRWSPP